MIDVSQMKRIRIEDDNPNNKTAIAHIQSGTGTFQSLRLLDNFILVVADRAQVQQNEKPTPNWVNTI